ncbi:amidohydrolase [Bacillus sp. UNC438CL73TsuS30]|uniref:amidohydrolase n=1 Tax=Bacillus sp. UNC438CL73TsuS30 TaxID=1340434 RepID=UPI0004798710|nr:amidohydrolase [Bacillus sp. UNC438CL73TsuS30]
MHVEVKADVILSSNAVFTAVDDSPRKASIAIIGNKIACVGSELEMEPYIGPKTKFYRFDDNLIMPGFNDVHTHVILGCLMEDTVNLLEAGSAKEAASLMRDFAEKRPNDQWILGFSWYHTYWENQQVPHRSELDAVIPDRPVFLLHAAGHIGWANSKALELAGINRDSADPVDGVIERDEQGEPTGILYENALSLVAKKAFTLQGEQRERIFTRFLGKAAKLGVTSVTDIFTLTGYEINELDLYEEFLKNGKLTTRIFFLTGLADIEQAKRLRDTYQFDKLQFSGLKEFLDGIVTAHTAHLVEPYSNRPETCGHKPPDRMKDLVLKADQEGFRIRFHAVGDGAVRFALDVFEEAQRINGKRDSRHTVEHIEVIHPDDIPRFAELGVLPSMQPEHMGLIERNHYVSCIGKGREPYTFPVKSLMETGATLILGTDYPIVELNPMFELYRAVSRVSGDGKPWNESEAVSLASALKAYTANAAYGVFKENDLGTLEQGKLADLIVLDRNLFNVPVSEIKDTKVKLTMMDGEIVFEDVPSDLFV